MRSLSESLFDRDLVEKEPIDNQLKDLVVFDGQWVCRLMDKSNFGFKQPHILEIIDWNKVRRDLKKFHGDKIDLGLYAYSNADRLNIRNNDTNKKTETFARLIMSIPFIEDCNFGSYNSRFRDEFLPKLNDYILPRWKDFHFELTTTRFGVIFTVHYEPWGDKELLRWEFLKNAYFN